MNGKAFAAALTVVMATLSACYQSTAYFRYFSTPIEGWERDSVLHYHVPAVRAAGLYVEEIGVRPSATYPFKQLSLVVDQKIISTNDSHSNIFKSDTIIIDVYDDEGHLRGKGIDLRQLVTPVKGLRLQAGDSIAMAIRHNMRRYAIEGISDVGLKVTRAYGD
ncbi:MAG: gliding motility lipoprotein GldH [Prevotella sp.]|nr:gliding motility lipoprotein GldH [Prevotella sp.]